MITVLIDGANLWATEKALGLHVDFKVLRQSFGSELLRMYYYTATLANDPKSIRPRIDWLDYNGFTLVTKPAKEFIDHLGRPKIKGNMDIEMAVDAIDAAKHSKDIWLFTGDGDFTYLVNALKRQGIRVTVVSTIKTQPVMIADELRRAADVFLELEDVINHEPRLKSKWS